MYIDVRDDTIGVSWSHQPRLYIIYMDVRDDTIGVSWSHQPRLYIIYIDDRGVLVPPAETIHYIHRR